MTNNVRLQDLRGFTMQIRHAHTDAILGTGIAVSMAGQIVTCAHVVRQAGIKPADSNGAEIGVYFPQAARGEEKQRRATIAACFPQHDDDVVLLQLTGGPAPLAPEQIAILGRAEDSYRHPFGAYGYRRLENYLAGWADGTILGPVEPPLGRSVQAEPVQLQSNQINRGMSGAAVLDVERNLVVGIVSETWYPDDSTKDRDTAWAVNARVLSLTPLNLPLRDAPLDKRPAPQPQTDLAEARAAVAPHLAPAWNNAPPALPEWVGRDDLLAALTADWTDPNRRVTGLIGFGGEGKSSLARKWVDGLISSPPLVGEGPGVGSPDGVFWWGFYERPSVDDFFEAALTWLSGGRIDPRRVPSANVRAQIIGAMLGAGRYLFILDGLEVLQRQEGDAYGLLTSADLRDLLTYLAAPGHPSFGLITSRAPLLDLVAYTTYSQHDVERLSATDGRALLRRIGVKGDDAAVDQVVRDWDGHALTLSLLGAYLAERHGGDVAHLADIPLPTAEEPRYERVHRILRRYDERLTEAERAFLKLFSAFRALVHESAFDKVFRPLLPSPQPSPQRGEGENLPSPSGTTGGRAGGEGDDLTLLVNRLTTYRLLRHDPPTQTYTTHPLIRNHYFALLTQGDRAQAQQAHERIKDYYLELAGDTPDNPTLDDLRPLIEVVHHACQAGTYDEAFDPICWERIYQSDRRVLVNQLGAWEIALALMLEFFPGGDASQDPQVSDPGNRRWILNEAGLCLMSLGRLSEAPPFCERSNVIALDMQDWHNASITYQNLAGLYAHLGELAQSAEAARQALDLARRAENTGDERNSLAYQAWTAHLRGDLETAGAAFQQAEALEREIDSSVHCLYSQRGVRHADHLRCTGQADYARRVAEANLKICEENHWPQFVSQCHRLLGDLAAAQITQSSEVSQTSELSERAHGHYDAALKIARSISHRPSLIEALLARGRWAGRRAGSQDLPGLADLAGLAGLALADLNEALGYALAGGYRIYEADIRVALAWAHRAAALTPNPSPTGREGLEQARAEAERVLQLSQAMGYHWGQVDAAEVLAALQVGA